MNGNQLRNLPTVLGCICAMWIGAKVVSADDHYELQTGIVDAEFQTEFDRRLRDGFRPIDVSLYSARRQTEMAWIWGKRSGPEFHVQTKLTAPELQKHAQEVQKTGFQLVRVSANALGTNVLYSGIWEKRRVPVHVRLGFDAKQFDDAHKTLTTRGSQPLQIHVVAVKGKQFFSGIWEDAKDTERVLETGLSHLALSKAVPKRAADGYRLRQVCGYPVGRGDRYGCVWEKRADGNQQLSLRLTQAGLAKATNEMQAEGFQPIQVSTYPQGGTNRFSVIWEASKK